MIGPEEIEDPNGGQRWVFHRIDGDVLEADLFVSPGGYVRDHLHPAQEETFTGVAGTLVLEVDGEPKTIGPGDSVVVPAGTRHGFEAASEPAELRVTVRPALRLAEYFRAFLGLSRDGKLAMPRKGLPKPLLLSAVLLHRFRNEIAAPELPVWLQRPVWWALALVARIFGHRASYPEYGAP
jgi:quercetin dioxygenase-like cupin family protein